MSRTGTNRRTMLLIGLVTAALAVSVCACDREDPAKDEVGRVTLTVEGGRVSVRPLLTNAERMAGVVRAGRLSEGEGVLFVYPRPMPELYWSNRTVLDQRLDVAFLDEAGRVTTMDSMASDTGNIVRSGGPAQYILIVPGGWLRARGLREGTTIRVPGRLAARAESVRANRELREIFVKDTAARVEIAATADARARGLMNRKTLAENHGMLFVYPSPREVQYYMKNTLVPLDVAFIKSSGRIHAIKPLVPLREKQVSSGSEVSFVLEMRRGWFRRHDITEGDRVDLSSVTAPGK